MKHAVKIDYNNKKMNPKNAVKENGIHFNLPRELVVGVNQRGGWLQITPKHSSRR